MTLKLLPIMTTAFLFSACSYTNSMNSFEDIYTDVRIVKPTSKNYKIADGGDITPIIKETITSSSEPVEQKSVHLKRTGRIVSTTYDQDVKLYLYTFITEPEGENIIFYFDQKLNHLSSDLLNVDILDNYLITATKYHDKTSSTISQKKKYIKHKKRNYNIREAIEEKINTF